jgi:hypothetical protein
MPKLILDYEYEKSYIGSAAPQNFYKSAKKKSAFNMPKIDFSFLPR